MEWLCCISMAMIVFCMRAGKSRKGRSGSSEAIYASKRFAEKGLEDIFSYKREDLKALYAIGEEISSFNITRQRRSHVMTGTQGRLRSKLLLSYGEDLARRPLFAWDSIHPALNPFIMSAGTFVETGWINYRLYS